MVQTLTSDFNPGTGSMPESDPDLGSCKKGLNLSLLWVFPNRISAVLTVLWAVGQAGNHI